MTEPALLNLSTQHLGYLAAVADSRTWGDASAALGVSPSALSQGIAELERRLGGELFAWEGRRRVPLPHTAGVIDHARRVLADTADLSRWLAEVRTGHVGRLRLGMIDAAAVHHFPEQLGRFRRHRPSLDLHLVVAPTGELLGQLRAGQLDLAVCVEPDDADLEIRPLLTEALRVYAPDGRRHDDPATWGPWVLFPATSRTRAVVEHALARLGAPLVIEGESHQPEVLREMVRMGLGWSVLPTVQAEAGSQPLRPARSRPLVERRLVAATRASGPHHPAVDELVGELTRTK